MYLGGKQDHDMTQWLTHEVRCYMTLLCIVFTFTHRGNVLHACVVYWYTLNTYAHGMATYF